MSSRRAQKFVDALIAGRRPARFDASESEAETIHTAITLQGARADLAEPAEEFISGLFDELQAAPAERGDRDTHLARIVRWPAFPAALAAAAAVLVAATFGVTEAVNHHGPASTTRTAVLTDALHRPDGAIHLYKGSPSWVFMTVAYPGYTGTVMCELEAPDGHVLVTGSFDVAGGHGEWARTLPVNPSQVRGARIVTTGGVIVASATFAAS